MCHFANLTLKMTGIGFNFIDILFAEYFWLKIVYIIIFIVN